MRYISFLLVLVTFTVRLALAQNPPPVLVAHWTFDEPFGKTAHDTEGNFPGTLSGGATFVAGGIAGNALSLSQASNSFVNMGTSFPGFTSGDFTIVAWVNTESVDTNTFVASKFASGTANGYLLGLNQFGALDEFAVPDHAVFYVSGAPGDEVTSSTFVNFGLWRQFVGVYRASGTATIYIDGAPFEESGTTPAVVANAAPFLIGGCSIAGVPTGTFTGLIDDVQVYSTALSDAQVQYLYEHPGRVAPLVYFDLVTDWSDATNPNSVWTYRESVNGLPHVASWESDLGSFTPAQPGWAHSENGNDRIPFWFQAVAASNFGAVDWLDGDVVVRSNDFNFPTTNANVVWTSPLNGTVDISGNTWAARHIDNTANNWTIFLNADARTFTEIDSDDGFDREHPMSLSLGEGGLPAITDIPVTVGDELRFEVEATTLLGDFVGVNFMVGVAVAIPSTHEAVLSYFLPKKLKVKIVGAGKDSIVASGVYDDGGATVDYTQQVTLEIGGYSQSFVLVPNSSNTTYKFKGLGLTLTLKPNIKGSSRGTFNIKLSKATLSGLIDPNAPIELHFRGTGLPDARGIVILQNGSFAVGKVKGTLVEPAFFPSKATATVNDTKPDVLSLTGGFKTTGLPPSSLENVQISFGDSLDFVVTGNSFGVNGNLFTATGTAGGGTFSMAIDIARETIKLKTKGAELGALPAGQDVNVYVDLGNGELPIYCKIRLGAKGTKRFY